MKKTIRLLAGLLAAVMVQGAAALPVSAANEGWNQDSVGWWYRDAAGGYESGGWARIGGSWYYFADSGYMETGWVRDSGDWYYMNGSGAMETGWVRDGGSWYYMNGSGAMETGWVRDNGNWYYLNESGRMLSNTLLELRDGVYWLDESGAMFVGQRVYNGETLTFGSDGALLTEGGSETDFEDVLVVFYSATGNTEEAAGYIAAATGGDLFELVPEAPYTAGDLDWTDSGSRVVYEHNNPSARDVELTADTVDNWDEYDTVFIGYPIWWGIAAWPVDDFIEANDFTGKTVIPFATSASSGLGESGKLLEEMAGTGDWLPGERFSSSVSEETVQAWIEGLAL